MKVKVFQEVALNMIKFNANDWCSDSPYHSSLLCFTTNEPETFIYTRCCVSWTTKTVSVTITTKNQW